MRRRVRGEDGCEVMVSDGRTVPIVQGIAEQADGLRGGRGPWACSCVSTLEGAGVEAKAIWRNAAVAGLEASAGAVSLFVALD